MFNTIYNYPCQLRIMPGPIGARRPSDALPIIKNQGDLAQSGSPKPGIDAPFVARSQFLTFLNATGPFFERLKNG